MVRVPTEKRYEEHIERELNSLLDDGLQFHSKVHQRDDTWYDKELCISPIPSLAVHFTNINSIFGLSPNVDWEKIWEESN